MKKIDLFIIDVQNDFCDPKGALYVSGADSDSIKLAEFIRENSNILNNIYMTLDSHHNYDIAHPVYWKDSQGNHPDPFTIISEEDVQSGKWRTSREGDRTHGEDYVKSLAAKSKYSLCIWPPHCLIGSWGTQIQDDVFKAVNSWEMDKITAVQTFYKGMNSDTEHYGALEAEIPQDDDPATSIQKNIVDRLLQSELIVIAGQALDFCVANTIRQISDNLGEKILSKIVLLEDCCSSVDPSSGLSDNFLKEMSKKGMRILKSTGFNEII